MKTLAPFLPLILVIGLFAQDKQYVDIPGAPVVGKPIWANLVGNNAVFAVAEKKIIMEDVEFKKPFFGKNWEIKFKLSNHLGRELEDLVFNILFYSEDQELLTDPGNAVTFAVDKVNTYTSYPKAITVTKNLWPGRYKEVTNIKMLLVSFKAPKTSYEKEIEQRTEEINARWKAEDDEWAKECAIHVAKEVAKERAEKVEQEKWATITKKKREEAIARQPSSVQEAIRKQRINIGMNREQIILSWGRPDHINTTTYARAIHEQWVYDIKTYVYFENGVVTVIQN